MSAGVGIARRSCGEGAEGGERLVELLEQGAFARKKIRSGCPLVLPEETVFLQGALVNGVAEPLVGLEDFGLGHGVEPVVAPPGGGLVGTGLGATAEAGAGF